MLKPKSLTVAALSLSAMILGATVSLAFAQGSTNPNHGSMMGPGPMQGMMPRMEAMTRMMDGCARMMQTAAPAGEGRTDEPVPAPDQTH
jgi:hypothetical protein